ncbi:MAG: hypothetical protein IJS39_02020 [Synergistaceae bacterium]|nr:hypothetical protein [Synergistaceae bacterium]
MQRDVLRISGQQNIGIGLNFLKTTSLKLGDMLPGLVYVVFFTKLFM